MEPDKLNSAEDAALESLLRRRSEPLPDDGFSARVMAALPERRAVAPRNRRLIWCLVGGAAGLITALVGGPWWHSLGGTLGQIDGAIGEIVRGFSDPLIMGALCVVAVSLVYVYWSELRQRLML